MSQNCLDRDIWRHFVDIWRHLTGWQAILGAKYYRTRCILLPENLRPVYVPKFEGKTCKNLGKFCQKCQKTSSGPTCRILLSYFLMGVAF